MWISLHRIRLDLLGQFNSVLSRILVPLPVVECFFFFFVSFYRPMGLAYDGHYTINTGGHLRPHSPAADCSGGPPLPQCHTICQPALTSWVYYMSPLYGPVGSRCCLFKCPTTVTVSTVQVRWGMYSRDVDQVGGGPDRGRAIIRVESM